MASKEEDTVQDSSDSSDDEYIPNNKELKVFKEDERETESLLKKRKGGYTQEVEQEVKQEEKKEIESEGNKKARIDKLWADFKGGVNDPLPRQQEDNTKETQVDTVTVKKLYDYAGQDIVVEERVSIDSKKGPQSLIQHTNTSVTNTSNITNTVSSKKVGRGGAQNLLASLKKKPKLSTLEKSKIDWNSYKREQGLEDELTFQSKDGYLERQAFLGRVDQRQFEIERNERLKQFKRLH